MMDTVLSAPASIWVQGLGAIPQGLEAGLERTVAQAIVSGRGHIMVDGKRHQMVILARGTHLVVPDDWMTAKLGEQPLTTLSTVVTTARVEKVEGYLVRQRANREGRSWLFMVGVNPLEFVFHHGIYSDPVVTEAGLISTPKSEAREVRKTILGFKDRS